MQSSIYNCPGCLQFNAQIQCCDLPENVPECTYLHYNQHPSFYIRHLIKQNTCTGSGTFPIPDDCHKYYECKPDRFGINIALNVKTCPKHTRFNQNEKKCTTNYKCPSTMPKCKPNGYVIDQYDCNKFYHCFQKTIIIPLFCQLGATFNGHFCQFYEPQFSCNWRKYSKNLILEKLGF